MVHARAAGQGHALVFLGLVAHDHQLAHAFADHAVGDLQHGVALRALAHALAAGHGDSVVVEDLVGDVDARSDALADRQQAAVEVGAVPQVGEQVLLVGERRLADPGHAFAAHLGEAEVLAVHPVDHVVAADAGHAARTLGQARAGVVRAAGAEPGCAVAAFDVDGLERGFLRIQNRQLCLHARLHIGRHAHLDQAPRDGTRDDGRVQVGRGAQQDVVGRVGHAPLAAAHVAFHLVELAEHVGTHIFTPVVELLLDLVFDQLALFFHYQDLVQPGGKVTRDVRLQRPHHAHLVHAHADAAAGVLVQPQILQRLAQVVVGLAAGDDAQAVVRPFDDVVIQPVGADVGQRGIPLGVEQARLLLQRGIGPANMHAAGRHLEIGDHHLHAPGVDLDAGAGFDHFLDRLHAGPDAGETAHGEGVDAEVEDFLHARREEHRKAAGLEDVVALVRGGAALADVVVAGDGDHAAPGSGAGHVGVLEHVHAAVHAWALAIPDAEHAVELLLFLGRIAQHLRAPDGGGAEFLVHAGLEHDVVLGEVLAGGLQHLVIAAERRAAVTADEAGRVLAGELVALLLQHRQAYQGLHATHEGVALVQGVFVVEGNHINGVAQACCGARIQGGVHIALSPCRMGRVGFSCACCVFGLQGRAALVARHDSARSVRLKKDPGHGEKR